MGLYSPVVTFFLEKSLKSCKLKFFQSFWIIWTFLDVPTEAVDIPQSQGLSDTVCLGWMLLKKRYYRKLFKFKKKISMKQAFFINEICSSRVWAKILFLNDWSKKIASKPQIANFIIQKSFEKSAKAELPLEGVFSMGIFISKKVGNRMTT